MANGFFVVEVFTCPDCDGKGKRFGRWTEGLPHDEITKCFDCNGKGYQERRVALNDALQQLDIVPYEDMRDDPDYQRFESEIALKCAANNPPCDGCLAGGMCDGPDEEDYIQEDGEWFPATPEQENT